MIAIKNLPVLKTKNSVRHQRYYFCASLWVQFSGWTMWRFAGVFWASFLL